MTRSVRQPPAVQQGRAPTGATRLLAEWQRTGCPASFEAHTAAHGPTPVRRYRGAAGRDRLIAAVTAAGLRGRGGAGFPTGSKLRAVGDAGGSPSVVVNACEGEPVSDKDHVLLAVAPHLVLDGAMLAAHALGARDVVVCVPRDGPVSGRVVEALGERPGEGPPARVVEVPRRYVASEESALVNYLNTGDARPTAKPPRPFERGVGGHPTLIGNAETMAQLALIARHGPRWFRAVGTADDPGSTLVTISGAVSTPGVYEAALGTPLGEVLRLSGPPAGAVQAVLVGGYGGGWLPLPQAAGIPFTRDALVEAGAALGVGALVVLPAHACGVAETARIMHYFAGESAAQCGPCMFGLPAIAEDVESVALGARSAGEALTRLHHRLPVITGRGACGHPDGAVRLAASALRTFGDDVAAHRAGRPCAGAAHARLPIPAWQHRSGDWR